MESATSTVRIEPIGGFRAPQSSHVNREEEESAWSALIAKFSALGQKFKDLDILKAGRVIASTAFALVGQSTAVAVAANFFNFEVQEKNEEIEKEINQGVNEEIETEIDKEGKVQPESHVEVKKGTSQKRHIDELSSSEKAELNLRIKEKLQGQRPPAVTTGGQKTKRQRPQLVVRVDDREYLLKSKKELLASL